MSDPIKHECGIALLKLKKPLEFYLEKYGTAFYGLNKMYLLMEKQRNRGQDGAGLANIKFDMPPGRRYISRKRSVDPNPIQDIFSHIKSRFEERTQGDTMLFQNAEWVKENLPFSGELFLGHLRYGTFGGNSIENCHPFLRQNNWITRNLIVAGNFNLTNVDELFEQLLQLGQHPKDYTDTITVLEKIGHFLDKENDSLYAKFASQGYSKQEITSLISSDLSIANILKRSAEKWDGGYAMAGLMGHGDAFVLRDPNGIRPVSYYQNDEIIAVASERAVLQTAFNIEASEVNEITPGCALIIKKNEDAREERILPKKERKSCSFERIYFSRGNDGEIYRERKKMGKLLVPRVLGAINSDVENTVFSFIPNTAEIAFYGLVDGIENALALKNPGKQTSYLRVEKIIQKDVKLRTFIADDKGRDDLVSHVYDITHGIIKKGIDTLVILDDSIVRGTTLKKSILSILDRLGPKRIIVVSSAPMICYPDCYGIDMAKIGDFVAFQAAVALLKEKGMENVLEETYKDCKNMLLQPKEENMQLVERVYKPHTMQEMERMITKLLTPENMQAEVQIIFQTVDDLLSACPENNGVWYFNGDYPTPGGHKVVNKAFTYYHEGKNQRAY